MTTPNPLVSSSRNPTHDTEKMAMGEPNEVADQLGEMNIAPTPAPAGFWKTWERGIKQMKEKHPHEHKYVESKGEELAKTWENALIGFRNIIDFDSESEPISNPNRVSFETNHR
eukprot:g23298.t1